MAAPRPFIMHGAREILEYSAGGVHIEQQVKALETALAESPNLAFDLSRSLVECVCRRFSGTEETAIATRWALKTCSKGPTAR